MPRVRLEPTPAIAVRLSKIKHGNEIAVMKYQCSLPPGHGGGGGGGGAEKDFVINKCLQCAEVRMTVALFMSSSLTFMCITRYV